MNSSRILNQEPLEDIDNEDLLFTNKFVARNSVEDLNQDTKENFKRYYETYLKNKKTDNLLKTIDYDEEYDQFMSFYNDNKNSNMKGNLINKKSSNVIKTEKTSIIDIDTSNRDINQYPNPNNIKFDLGKTFYNIKQIKLVSTTIPNTDQVITNTPVEIRNNRIAWQNYEDIDLGIYSNVSVSNNIADHVDIEIQNHRLATQSRIGDLYVKISKSTSTPNIDGERFAYIIDSNTIRIPFKGGIIATATATVDVGFPTYVVELTPGNYTATSIATEIQKQLNLVKRRNQSGLIYHYFTVDVSLDTDVLTFRSYITKQLENNPISTQAGTGVITVNSVAHGFKSGDYVLMIGFKNTGGLTSTILNGLFIVDVLDSNTFTYEVNERASEAADGGGATCKTGEPSEFRLLFDTSESIIVYNIGFPDEDSGEYLNRENGLSLSTLTMEMEDVSLSGDYLTITSSNHGLEETNIYTITGITTGSSPEITTSGPHNMTNQNQVYIYYPYSTPALDNFYYIIPNGATTFLLRNVVITTNPGGSGLLKYGGDSIQLINFKSRPLINNRTYLVENTTTNTFDIHVTTGINSIESDSKDNTVISTDKLFINHPNHGFNNITAITSYSSTKALITTLVNHGLEGIKHEGISASSVVTNTVDLIITSHGFTTSDTVLITNSTTNPSINGDYVIQVIDVDTIRISYIGGLTTSGTCDVNKGDTVVFSKTNSSPNITSDINGNVSYYINKINDTQFTIDTGFLITTPGDSGILGRNDIFSLHRVESSEPNGDNFAGIPLNSINHNYHPVDKIIDENNYLTHVGKFAQRTYSGGGTDIFVSSEKHGFRTFQSNTDTGEESGVLFRSISLEGENYIFLISPNLQTVYSPGNEKVGDILAKILLNEPPGLMMFDSYVSAPKDFNPPIASLKELEFTMKRRDGYPFNFNNINYSISLEITEITDQIDNTGISGRTGTSDLYSRIN